MKSGLASLALVALLCGCDTIGEMLEPPAMVKPVGIPSTIPPQDTPALEARAAKEREELPKVPPPPDPQTYANLGTVPPRPVLPTPTEIAGQVKGLADEQAARSAIIAQQADADEPETLPKPDGAAKTQKPDSPDQPAPAQP